MLKVLIREGFDGRSCFDSPDVGDVERISLTPNRLLLGVASTLPMWEMLKDVVRVPSVEVQAQVASTLPMWEMLKDELTVKTLENLKVALIFPM